MRRAANLMPFLREIVCREVQRRDRLLCKRYTRSEVSIHAAVVVGSWATDVEN